MALNIFRVEGVGDLHTSVGYIDANVLKYLNASCVVFDTETTGLHRQNDRLLEVAGFKLVDGKIVDTLNIMINPGRPIPAEASKINHITDEMVANMPKEDYYAERLLNFLCGVHFVVGHNVKFDLDFIDALFERNGITFDCYYLDTLQLAKKYLPGYSSYKLGVLAGHLGYQINGLHRAIYDVELTTQLLRDIAKKAAEKL